MIDSQRGLTTQEKQIATDIEKAGKGCLLFFNKWDLVKNTRMEHCLASLREDAKFLGYCPALFGSAITERNLDKIFPAINDIHEASKRRITTHDLNKFVGDCLQKQQPPMINGKRLRIYYMAQVNIQPPQFVFFINFENRMTQSYQRFLYNQMRQKYGFQGAPLVLKLKQKKRQKELKAIQ